MGPVLEARTLKKSFGTGKKRVDAVRGVSLRIDPGEIYAFLGPNGAGKTTTVKMVAALVVPDGGWVEILGESLFESRDVLRHVGAVLEGNRNLYWRLTVEENLEYFGVLRGVRAAEARRRGRELIDRLELGASWHRPVRNLSRGQQQRVALAVALVHQPKLLLLDEPTLGLDVESAAELKRLIREVRAEGRAVLLTTHQLADAEELADRVGIIQDGSLVVEEATPALLARFSEQSYRLAVEGEIDATRRLALEGLGARFVNGHLSYAGPAENLYELIEVLRPLPLVRLEKRQADLTQVFLELTRDKRRSDARLPD